MSKRNTDAHAVAFKELFKIIDALLAPDGCPWDREQTPESMCDYLAEETFELIEGIRNQDANEAMEELGDVMFILQFIATLYEQKGDFSLKDSLKATAAKMVRRHPHVFGNKNFADRQALLDNWEATKKAENNCTNKKWIFDSLPKGLPPLLKAYRIHSKAARNQFTWDHDCDVERQLEDEWQEWKEAEASGDADAMEKEFGDYLFTLVELARRKGIKANSALSYANQKFLKRFNEMEILAEQQGMDFSTLDSQTKNTLWDTVKTKESN